MGKSSGFLSTAKAMWDGAAGALDTADKVYEKGKEALYVAVPVTALAAAYMASRLISPGGVKGNVPDIVIANNERANLMQSIRELERLKLTKALKSTAKPHDQFV